MIELISDNGTALVLDPKTKIRVEWNSAIFAEDAVEGDKVYWFDLPLHPVNVKELGHPNEPGISGKARIYKNYLLQLLGVVSMKGTLIVSTVSNKLRVAFTTNNLQDYKEMKLNEVDFGSSISLGSTQQDVIDHADTKSGQSYPTAKYNFPVIANNKLYGSENPAYLGYLNNYDWENDTYFKNYLDEPDEDEEAPDGIINKYPLSPQFYLRWILDKLFLEMAYDHFGDFITESEYSQLMLYNGFCLDDNHDEYWLYADNGTRDPTAIWPQGVYFQGNFSIGSEMTGSLYGWGCKIVHEGWHQFKLKVKATAPTPIQDLTVEVQTPSAPFGSVTIPAAEALSEEIVEVIHTYYAPASEIGDEVFCYCNSYWTLVDATFEVVNLSQTNLNRYLKTITPANHMPAVLINDFLNALRKFWSMAVIIDSSKRQAEFLFLKHLFETKAQDFTDKIAKGEELESIDKKKILVDFDWDKDENFLDTSMYNDQGDYDMFSELPVSRDITDIVTINPANCVYKVFYEDFENFWKRFTDFDQAKTYGDGDEEMEIDISMHPTFMTGYIHSEERGKSEFLYALPMVNKQGKSKLFNSDNDEDPALKLMHWVGLSYFEKLDENNGTVPFASSHNINSKGGSTGYDSLFLNGATGLAAQYHDKWFDFLKNTETYVFKGGANFNEASLLKLIELIKPQDVSVTSQYRWMTIESINYLPKQVTAEVSMNGLESVEIKAVKKAYEDNATYNPGSGS